jgi:hypothetical protein
LKTISLCVHEEKYLKETTLTLLGGNIKAAVPIMQEQPRYFPEEELGSFHVQIR